MLARRMGAILSFVSWPVIAQLYPPKSKFSVDQIPDLTGRVAIVTGGNAGCGYEIVKALLQHNAKVYLAARNKAKADTTITTLKELTGREAIFLEVDLASLASVKRSAEEFLRTETDLHILFNNAGVMWPFLNEVTRDGYDLQWGTNVVGHFYFTELLMPALLAGVKTSPDHHARVITTSSITAYLETLHYETFKDGPERRKMSTKVLYNQSKLANAIVARQVAKRYTDKGIISISANPGNLDTDILRCFPPLQRIILRYFGVLYTPRFGALTPLFAGTMPEALKYNGEFMIPWARLGKCRPEVYDDAVGEQLWKWLEDEVKSFEAQHQSSTTPIHARWEL